MCGCWFAEGNWVAGTVITGGGEGAVVLMYSFVLIV